MTRQACPVVRKIAVAGTIPPPGGVILAAKNRPQAADFQAFNGAQKHLYSRAKEF